MNTDTTHGYIQSPYYGYVPIANWEAYQARQTTQEQDQQTRMCIRYLSTLIACYSWRLAKRQRDERPAARRFGSR